MGGIRQQQRERLEAVFARRARPRRHAECVDRGRVPGIDEQDLRGRRFLVRQRIDELAAAAPPPSLKLRSVPRVTPSHVLVQPGRAARRRR